MIELVIFSLFAGVLTILAPCVLPVIPIILGGSVAHTDDKEQSSLSRPLYIIAGLVLSIFIFSLLLKSSTLLLTVPTFVWSLISGLIIVTFGLLMVFPGLWERIGLTQRLALFANTTMYNSQSKGGRAGLLLLGASLGLVFNSCSPTYALIISVLLPQSFAAGLLYLAAYCIGLGAMLLLLAIFGRSIIVKLKWAVNPNGVFHKIIGILFIIVGLMILLGLDKSLQAAILSSGLYDPVAQFEQIFTR